MSLLTWTGGGACVCGRGRSSGSRGGQCCRPGGLFPFVEVRAKDVFRVSLSSGCVCFRFTLLYEHRCGRGFSARLALDA